MAIDRTSEEYRIQERARLNKYYQEHKEEYKQRRKEREAQWDEDKISAAKESRKRAKQKWYNIHRDEINAKRRMNRLSNKDKQ